MDTGVVLLVLLIVFVSTFIRAILGFGNALLAMPLLTFTVGITVATPLVGCISALLACLMLIGNWQHVDVKVSWQLVLASLLGLPVGLWLLIAAPEDLVKAILGASLIVFGGYNLIRVQLPGLRWWGWVYLFGFAGGILGAAYNTNGPAVVVYGVLCRWPPERFRATLQGYFLLTGLGILLIHGMAGLWTREVVQLFGYSLPVIALSLFLGAKLNDYIPRQWFEHLVHVALILIGGLLML